MEMYAQEPETPFFGQDDLNRTSTEVQGRKRGGIWSLRTGRMVGERPIELKIVSAPLNSGQPRTLAGEHQFRQLRKLITIRISPEPSRVGWIFTGSPAARSIIGF
jgi:hypothetical protein